jgi:hypothetical protein
MISPSPHITDQHIAQLGRETLQVIAVSTNQELAA